MKVLRLPDVDAEALEAAQYYAAIDHKLGLRLGQEFEATVERIRHFPLGWKPIDVNLRQCGVKGFPYVVVYLVRSDEIVIVAFANTHRRPNYWRSRLEKPI